MKAWSLKRTKQCAKCPWRKDVNPHDIPDGYDEQKHKRLANTIAVPGDFSCIVSDEPQHVMACHETADAHCIGWLDNQVNQGNNILLRFQTLDCDNIGDYETVGEQHETFEDTFPAPQRKTKNHEST